MQFWFFMGVAAAVGFLLGGWAVSVMLGGARREECDLCCLERMELCRTCKPGVESYGV